MTWTTSFLSVLQDCFILSMPHNWQKGFIWPWLVCTTSFSTHCHASSIMPTATKNIKRSKQLPAHSVSINRHHAVSLRQHGFLVLGRHYKNVAVPITISLIVRYINSETCYTIIFFNRRFLIFTYLYLITDHNTSRKTYPVHRLVYACRLWLVRSILQVFPFQPVPR